MKHATLLVTAILLSTPLIALADVAPPSNVEAAFGNTFLTIDADGRTRKVWFEPNGSWTGSSRTGKDLAGTWKMKGEKLCLSQSKPALPVALCQILPNELKLGGPAVTDPSGKSSKIQLVKGHVTK